MKTFFAHIGSSIYNPAFYTELTSKPFGFSFKYYLKLAVLLSLLATIVFAFSVIPAISAKFDQYGRKFANSYPADLEITITKGQASINRPEPYFIPLSDETPNDLKEKDVINLVVIDTKRSFDLTTFENYRTVAWLTKDSIAMYRNSSGNQVQFISLKDVPDTVITRDQVNQLVNRLLPIARALPWFLIPFIFLIGLFYFAYRMVYLLIFALLIWVLLSIMKREIKYRVAYQIGLHAMTLPLIITLLGLLVGFSTNLFLMWFTVLMLIIVGINHLGGSKPVAIDTPSQTPTP